VLCRLLERGSDGYSRSRGHAHGAPQVPRRAGPREHRPRVELDDPLRFRVAVSRRIMWTSGASSSSPRAMRVLRGIFVSSCALFVGTSLTLRARWCWDLGHSHDGLLGQFCSRRHPCSGQLAVRFVRTANWPDSESFFRYVQSEKMQNLWCSEPGRRMAQATAACDRETAAGCHRRGASSRLEEVPVTPGRPQEQL
jgi:hypothetical protein